MERKIDVFILGAAKAGTSTLKVALGNHPDIFVHAQREFPFFMATHMYERGFRAYYKAYFDCAPKDDLILAKSAGPMVFPEILHRISTHNPGSRVICILRNPVDRAYSAYWFSRQRGHEDAATFEDALRMERKRLGSDATDRDFMNKLRWGYRLVGQYDFQIANLWRIFGKENVLLLDFDELKADPQLVFHKAIRWLGLRSYVPDSEPGIVNKGKGAKSEAFSRAFARCRDPNTLSGRFARAVLPYRMRTKVKERVFKWNEIPLAVPAMADETRQELISFFGPFNAALGVLTGRDYDKWNS